MTYWFSSTELAGLPGLPGTDRRVRTKAEREGWQSRKRAGRGGGLEYHISSLPAQTQQALHPVATTSNGGKWRICIKVDAAAMAAGLEISIEVGRHE